MLTKYYCKESTESILQNYFLQYFLIRNLYILLDFQQTVNAVFVMLFVVPDFNRILQYDGNSRVKQMSRACYDFFMNYLIGLQSLLKQHCSESLQISALC